MGETEGLMSIYTGLIAIIQVYGIAPDLMPTLQQTPLDPCHSCANSSPCTQGRPSFLLVRSYMNDSTTTITENLERTERQCQ